VLLHAGLTIALTIGLVILSVIGILSNNNHPSISLVISVIVVGFLVGVAALLQGYRDTKDSGVLDNLEKEETGYEPLDYFELLNSHLATIANHALGLEASDRISIYSVDAGKFWMQGRYSSNPEYVKRGRTVYPIDQGCIGGAWTSPSGSCFIPNLPDPIKEREKYFERLKNGYQIPKGVSRNFQMKSRCLVAFVVYDKAREHGQAVVVIESMIPDKFDFDQVNRKWKDEGAERVLSNFLEVLKPIKPESTYATERGI